MNIDELRREIKDLKRAKAAIAERISDLENEIYKKLIAAQLELFDLPKDSEK